MPILSTWADVETHLGGWDDLTAAEQAVITASKNGEACVLGDGELPIEAGNDPARVVRADLLRFLVTGGCAQCPMTELGLSITGASITGKFSLRLATANGGLSLEKCKFQRSPVFSLARLETLSLRGSMMHSLHGNAVTITNDLNLSDLDAEGEIRLPGAKIGGQLVLSRAKIDSDSRFALNAHSTEVQGGVFLRHAYIGGEINFIGATIGSGFYIQGSNVHSNSGVALLANNLTVDGDVSFSTHSSTDGAEASMGRKKGTQFTGEVVLSGADIRGRLNLGRTRFSNPDGHAFNGQRMKVALDLVWRNTQVDTGVVSLNGAHIGELADDPEAWPLGRDQLVLVGLTYDRIKGKVSLAKERFAWLKAGSHFEGEFYPQPYTQYAKFLRDAGHDREARTVLATRERLNRAVSRERRAIEGGLLGRLANCWYLFWDVLLRVVAGYGHHPFRSVAVLTGLVLLAILPASRAWEEGSMAPNSGVILASADWRLAASEAENPAKLWSAAVPGKDYETFNRYAYAADLVIPLIHFGQTEAWAPSTERGPWGWHLWWMRWMFMLFGWIVTALGAAAITGLIRQD